MNSDLRQTRLESSKSLSWIFLSVQIFFSIGSWIAILTEMTDSPRDWLLGSSIIGAFAFLAVAVRAVAFKCGFWIVAASAFVLASPLLYTVIAIAVFGLGWTNC